MKFKRFLRSLKRFFGRFNPWLFLVSLLLAIAIWCVAMYTKDPKGIRNLSEDASVAISAASCEPV